MAETDPSDLGSNSSGAKRFLTHLSTGASPGPMLTMLMPIANSQKYLCGNPKTRKTKMFPRSHMTQRIARNHGRIPCMLVFQRRAMRTRMPQNANGTEATITAEIITIVLLGLMFGQPMYRVFTLRANSSTRHFVKNGRAFHPAFRASMSAMGIYRQSGFWEQPGKSYNRWNACQG